MDPQRHWSQRFAMPCCLWTSAGLFLCALASLATDYWWWLPLLPLALRQLSLCVIWRPSRYAKLMAIVWPVFAIGVVLWEVVEAAADWLGAVLCGSIVFLPGCLGFWFAAAHHESWLLDDAIDVRENVCEHCGYPLRGLRSARCPECGKPFGGAR